MTTVLVQPPPSQRMVNELPLVLAISLLAAALVWFDGPTMLRVPFGLIAVLLLPGYSLEAALLPGGGGVGVVEHLALGFGISLAIIAILALGLTYMPWGLTPMPIVLVLTAWTCLATAVAWWRRLGFSAHTRTAAYGRSRGALRVTWLAVVVAATTLIVVAVSLALTVVASPPRMTEFFVLGRPELAEGYPRSVEPGQPVTVTVGITNREDAVNSYRVTLEEDAGLLLATGPVELAPGETWHGPMTFSLPGPGKNQEIRIVLHKDGTTGAYRELTLWVDSGVNEGF